MAANRNGELERLGMFLCVERTHVPLWAGHGSSGEPARSTPLLSKSHCMLKGSGEIGASNWQLRGIGVAV